MTRAQASAATAHLARVDRARVTVRKLGQELGAKLARASTVRLRYSPVEYAAFHIMDSNNWDARAMPPEHALTECLSVARHIPASTLAWFGMGPNLAD